MTDRALERRASQWIPQDNKSECTILYMSLSYSSHAGLYSTVLLWTAEETDTKKRFETWARRVHATRRITGGRSGKDWLQYQQQRHLHQLYEMLCRLVEDRNFEMVLEVESEYRHPNTFSNDPLEDVLVLTVFGSANHAGWISAQDEICGERAINYFERAHWGSRRQWSTPGSKCIKVRNWTESCPFVLRRSWHGKSDLFA